MSIVPRLYKPDSDPPSTNVAEIVKLYLAAEEAKQGKETFTERKRILDLFCVEFGHIEATSIRKADVKLWVRRHETWKSDWTIKRVYGSLARPFSWAMADDLIERNPLAGLYHPSGESGRALTDDEYVQLLRATDSAFRQVLTFLRFTGARPGELRAIRWEHVDLVNCIAVLYRDQATGKYLHKTARKTRKPRVIALLPCIVKLMKLIRRKNPQAEYVFLNSRGRPWTKSAIDLRIYRLRERVGLASDAKLYGLRHKFCCDAVLAGVPIKAVAELVGHADSRTTEKNYVKVSANTAFLHENLAKAFKKPEKHE